MERRCLREHGYQADKICEVRKMNDCGLIDKLQIALKSFENFVKLQPIPLKMSSCISREFHFSTARGLACTILYAANIAQRSHKFTKIAAKH